MQGYVDRVFKFFDLFTSCIFLFDDDVENVCMFMYKYTDIKIYICICPFFNCQSSQLSESFIILQTFLKFLYDFLQDTGLQE